MSEKEEAAGSAAQTAYYIPEVRACVLRQLDASGLARFMRVEKGCMAEVSRELYREITYEESQRLAKMDSSSGAVYRNSVKTIDCRSIRLTRAIEGAYTGRARPKVDLEESEDGYSSPEDPLDVIDRPYQADIYNSRLVNITLLPLRKAFRGLRLVLFGLNPPTRKGDRWIVHLHPKSSPSKKSTSIGHVDLLTRLLVGITNDLTRIVYSPPPPALGYTMSARYDLYITGEKVSALVQQKWHAAIQDENHPLFSRLNEEIDFGVLPVDLADITLLYERQVRSGSDLRLRRIIAQQAVSFDIRDLDTFTSVMSRLEVLILCKNQTLQTTQNSGVHVSFHDLPAMVIMISEGLPQLRYFGIAVKGVSTAEKVCRGMLSESLLTQRGSLDFLHISTRSHSIPLFNTIRFLSSLCATGSTISVGPFLPAEQEVFMRYLRSQSSQSLPYLATIDFANLDISTLRQVSDLQYHLDGRPRRLGETKIDEWLVEAMQMLEIAQNRAIAGDNHLSFVHKYVNMLERLQRSAPTMASQAMLDGMIDLSGSIGRMVRATRGGWEIPGRELREKAHAEIAAFVSTMRIIVSE